jgi:hypothetical protein
VSGALLTAVLLVVAAPPPAGADTGAIWQELVPQGAAEELDDATWFAPPPASVLLLELDVDEVPLIWRVDRARDSQPASMLEQIPHALGAGQFLVWIAPSPQADWAVVSGGRTRAWTLRANDDPRALRDYERALWRWASSSGSDPPPAPAVAGARPLRSALLDARDGLLQDAEPTGALRAELLRLRPLAPGARWPWAAWDRPLRPTATLGRDQAGRSFTTTRPGLLRLRTWAVGEPDTPTVPIGLYVERSGGFGPGGPAAELTSSGRVGDDGRSASRDLELLAPPGYQMWNVWPRAPGHEIEARMQRPRPSFPHAADHRRMVHLARQGPGVERARRAEEAIDEAFAWAHHLGGRTAHNGTTAQDHVDEVAASIRSGLRRDEPWALMGLARLQSRLAPPEGDPPALPALEHAILRRDLAGDLPAGQDLRDAARDAWLQASSYVFRDVQPPPGAELVHASLRVGHGLAVPAADGHHRPGVYSFLPPGEEVALTVRSHPHRPERWAVLQFLGLDLDERSAVVTLTVDGGEPLQVVLSETWTPFRIALEPGVRLLQLDLPEGGAERVGVALDLPVEAAAGPFGAALPHLRWMRAVRLAGAETSGRFELPSAGGPAHLRVDAWWIGDEPREVVLTTEEGRRRAVLFPSSTAPALIGVEGAQRLSAGSVAVDLDGDVGWLTVTSLDEQASPLWLRVASRQAVPRAAQCEGEVLDAGGEPELTGGDLAGQTRQLIAAAGDPAAEFDARLSRAARLLELGLTGYARRDIEAARAQLDPEDFEGLAAVESLARRVLSLGDSRHVVVESPPDRVDLLPLDLPAAAGHGRAGWLDEFAADAPAALVSAGRLHDLVPDERTAAAVQLALADEARGEAMRDPAAAVRALAHAAAAREVVDDPRAARITHEAAVATRTDVLVTAASSPDRVVLRGPLTPPDPQTEPYGWARWTLLGAPLQQVDRVIGAGTRWVLDPGPGAPGQVTVEALCDDLRVPGPAVPDICHVEVRVGDREARPWSVPRGEVSTLTLDWRRGEPLEIELASEGHGRYMAVGLVAPGWRVPDRRALFHVATPDEAVRYRVVGPTRLAIEVAARCGEAGEVGVQVLDGAEVVRSERWHGPRAELVADRGESYGDSRTIRVSLHEPGVHELELRADGAPVAVRVAQRLPAELILPPPPAVAEMKPDDAVRRDVSSPWREPRVIDRATRLPRPSPAGTVDASLAWRTRVSVDDEPDDVRLQYLEITAGHRLRVARSTWLRGGPLVRLWGQASPSAGLALDASHRFHPVELRLRGRARGLVQRVEGRTRGAMSLDLRVDRPTRLATGLVLLPHLRVRGYVQPEEDLRWSDGSADPAIASDYRQAHPFGLGVGVDLLARPWVDGEFAVGLRAMSNSNVGTVDHAGGHGEFRLYPRPVGLAVGMDLSRRFADDGRAEAWWRAELDVRVWADLGPPSLWIRPDLSLSWLFDPGRLQATVGVTVTPGRRALVHHAPEELLFEDLREPSLIRGRWRR